MTPTIKIGLKRACLLSAMICLLAIVTGCGTSAGQFLGGLFVKPDVQVAVPEHTNTIAVVTVDYRTNTVVVTNMVTVSAASTNTLTGVITPAVIQPQILPTVTLTPFNVTNNVQYLVPPTMYTNYDFVALDKLKTLGNVAQNAGVPYASAVATALGGIGAAICAFIGRRNAIKAKNGVVTKLDDVSAAAGVLAQNIDTARDVLKSIPSTETWAMKIDALKASVGTSPLALAAIDALSKTLPDGQQLHDDFMAAIRTAQVDAGVKADVHEIVKAATA